MQEPKIWAKSKVSEIIAYFRERWANAELLRKKNNNFYLEALEILKDISGKCHTNIIFIFNSFLGKELFDFSCKKDLRDYLTDTADIKAVVAYAIAKAVFKQAGLYFLGFICNANGYTNRN